MYQKLVIVGNLGKDPQTKALPSGTTVCEFSVGVTEKSKSESKTEWFNIAVWGKSGENCQKYLAKGSKVLVEGKLNTNKWQDSEGATRYKTTVFAQSVQFLSSRNNQGQQERPVSETPMFNKLVEKGFAPKSIDDPQIPF